MSENKGYGMSVIDLRCKVPLVGKLSGGLWAGDVDQRRDTHGAVDRPVLNVCVFTSLFSVT
jgi:23S rRNA G2069 N7-methylase RlmK/C1962 C5-methylase RlmI